MAKVHITEIILGFQDSNILWLIIPIFFIGLITDKYQEEFGTSVGNAISNGALIIFTGFSWLQLITSRGINFPVDVTLSQTILTGFIIFYGLSIVFSGFLKGIFAKTYGRIRVITFMLIFFTIIIYVPILYNFVSVILFVLLFPFYYAFITELIKVLPSARSKNQELNSIKKNIKFQHNSKSLENAKNKLIQYLK